MNHSFKNCNFNDKNVSSISCNNDISKDLIEFINVDDNFTNGALSSGTVDVTFRNVQKNFTNFLIWRIESMNVVLLPKDQYGTFHSNDSYIIYAASQPGLPSGIETLSREMRGGTLEYHIHFWLGSTTTPDKSGVAAYKTVELDGHLGGIATQHRETQGNESPRFKSYFKNGFRILKGGTSSSFKSVSKHFEPKLYKVKGCRTPVITEQDGISWNSFNSGDIFILLTQKTIFVWIGRAANGVEKLHAAKTAVIFKSEYTIPNIIFVDDGYEKTLLDEYKKDLDKYLPLSKRVVLPPKSGDSDEESEKRYRTNLKLYKCIDNNGKYRVTEIKSGPLQQSDLSSEDVYIIDNGENGIWVWVGKKASSKERTEALRNARGFVKKKSYPNNTRVTRLIDGAEPLEFKVLFLNWKDKSDVKNTKNGSASKATISKMDALSLHERPALAAESQLVDDGSGTLQIWRVSQNSIMDVPKKRYGMFFSSHCYLVLYSYEAPTLIHMIYYWLGLDASEQDAILSLKKVAEINNEFNGKAVQIHVIQGHEPPHFLQIFKGKTSIFEGSMEEYEDKRNSHEFHHYLLQIFGSNTFSSKAVQVKCKASSLNSNYCYVLRKHKHYYIWCGSYSTGDQREMSKGFVGKDFEIVLEGKETPDFWKCIEGRESYISKKLSNESGDFKAPRLYQCSTSTGNFKVEEILNYSQGDLLPEDVMLLDAHTVVFIWIGNYSTKEERRLTLTIAKKYLENDPAGRNLHTPIIEVKQGCEPLNFIGFFTSWDNKYWNKTHKSFEDYRSDIEGKCIKNGCSTERPILQEDEGNFNQYDKYPVAVLRSTNENLPSKVDILNKEMHLTHDDFVSLFKMNYAEFDVLPKWKKQELKKNVGLF